mgnify:CR=1 FL=1
MEELRLREITMERHKDAERSNFAKKLVSGKVTKAEYSCYLYNMRTVYSWIETSAVRLRALEGIEGIRRTKAITSDHKIIELNSDYHLKSTLEYTDYLASINRTDTILAHVYVRHMGDLSGGQMIKDKVPGSGKMYTFEAMTHSVDEMKALIRKRTKDSMADEANKSFEFSTKIFEELNDLTY